MGRAFSLSFAPPQGLEGTVMEPLQLPEQQIQAPPLGAPALEDLDGLLAVSRAQGKDLPRVQNQFQNFPAPNPGLTQYPSAEVLLRRAQGLGVQNIQGVVHQPGIVVHNGLPEYAGAGRDPLHSTCPGPR